ncbi:hypothetical protein [Streptomyces sp. NPDC056165]|uniref:hypothetical protein n=1 Tax=Streptomyces sp. NPDC056165 TaxID=3345733 RepID=UPI0035D94F55
MPTAQPPPASSRLGAGEAAVVITAITAVTVLTALECPIPAVLTALITVACPLLFPGRAADLLNVLTGGR